MFKKDIYKSLRAERDDSIIGWRFKKMLDVDYKDALIYPRFKFLYGDKPHRESGIFETSDYKTILKVFGDRGLTVGSTFRYQNSEFEITNISVDILDLVLDYSNGHTDYFLGKPIPFHIEIIVLVKDTNILNIAINYAVKYERIKEKTNLSEIDEELMELHRISAEEHFQKMLEKIKNNADLHKAYALFKSKCGQYEEAINHFFLALEINKDDPEIYFNLGYEYGLLGNREKEKYYMLKAKFLGSKDAKDYLSEN